MVIKLQLISPISEFAKEDPRMGEYPPLPLIALASYIKRELPATIIEILDGELIPQKKILKKLGADVVGIHVHLGNIKAALSIARKAKEKGAKVILGGPFASVRAQQILRNRKFVDAIVIGDGEEALLEFIKGTPSEKIPNLAYRKKGEIKVNDLKELDLDRLPPPDYGLVILEPYFKKFKENEAPYRKGLVVYSQKSCPWRERLGCIFCGVLGKKWRAKSPEKVWSEIKSLVERYGVDYIYEASSSFTSNKEWLREFVKTKPKDLNVAFRVYARSSEIDEEVAELLKKINCNAVFIGFESGDNRMLKAFKKGESVEQHLNAIRHLKKYGIPIHASFVLGAPGESKETLQKTFEFAKKIVKESPFVFCSTFFPVPGSSAFEELSKKVPKYARVDVFDWEQLKKDWVKHFCNVSYEDIVKTNRKILKLAPGRTAQFTPDPQRLPHA